MFLSKLTLDPHHAKARLDLGNAYQMHRTLARAYAPDAKTPPRPFLWRLEQSGNIASRSTLLVQSDVPADWSMLESLPGYVTEVLGNKRVDLEKLIKKGARYRFRLLVNPTVTRNGKRHGLTTEGDQLAWISRQGDKHGFSVLACVRGGTSRIQVHQGKSGNRITVHTALFDGLIEGIDPERLRLAVRSGLGHAKALGLRLLSLGRTA
jgi:CRISPR system Cascade subunit CasE